MRNKTICIVIATLLLVCTTIVAVNADGISPPIGQPNFGDVYGHTSRNENIPNYDKTFSQDLFSGCLAFAYLHMQEFNWNVVNPMDGFFMKSSSAGYERSTRMNNLRKHFLMMTTWKSAGTSGSATMRAQIYFAYTYTGAGTYVQVDAIPEEWGKRGASFAIRGNASICGMEVWQVYLTKDGSLIFQLGSSRATFNFNTASTSQIVTLDSDEQIVYASATIGNGWSDMYEYGYRTAPNVAPPVGATKWINAYKAFNGGSVGGGGFTQDDLDNAYDDGYMDGEQSGYHQGAQDGYANGYTEGYDSGYEDGLETGYEDGKADGVTEGYQNGKADGVTEGYANGYTEGYDSGYEDGLETGYDNGYMDGEQSGYHQGAQDGYANGYANGYDKGYDNGVETGYEDGKADGVTEGYQNGKADGVAEGYANGYDKGYDNGVETGYEDGKADGVTEGYQNGKADGVAEGYANGYDIGYDNGYETGYDEGYDYGYNFGESVGSTKIDIGEIISAVPEGAKSVINGAFGFEIFGINVAGTLTALLVVAIVAFVVKKLMTR